MLAHAVGDEIGVAPRGAGAVVENGFPIAEFSEKFLKTTDGEGVYAGLPREFSVIRYHSLAIEPESCPAELVVSARSEDGEIMGVRHRELAGTATPLEGVQFHPESILSEHGHAMLRNFISMGRPQ